MYKRGYNVTFFQLFQYHLLNIIYLLFHTFQAKALNLYCKFPVNLFTYYLNVFGVVQVRVLSSSSFPRFLVIVSSRKWAKVCICFYVGLVRRVDQGKWPHLSTPCQGTEAPVNRHNWMLPQEVLLVKSSQLLLAVLGFLLKPRCCQQLSSCSVGSYRTSIVSESWASHGQNACSEDSDYLPLWNIGVLSLMHLPFSFADTFWAE